MERSCLFTPVSTTPTVSTNIPQYEYYDLDRVIDGNPDSFFWSSEAQAEGQYIMLTYPNSQPQYEITVTFTANDQPSGTVAIEISDDNTQWTPIAEFTAEQLDDTYSFTCNANGESARYVRFVIRSYSGGYWLQVAEFKSEMAAKETQTADQDGKQIATLSDRDLTTSYRPTAAGYIEHRFIENLNIETIEIFHNTTFDNRYELPTIYVNNGTEWIETGQLSSLCTIIDTHEMELVTAIKIEWNEENIPTLYEILPCGTPYVEKPGTATAIEQPASAGTRLYTRDNRLHVESDATITSLTLYDLSGRIVARFAPQASTFETMLDTTMPRALIARVSDGNQNISTYKIIW